MKSQFTWGQVIMVGLVWLLMPVGFVPAAPVDTVQSCAAGGFLLCKNGKCGANFCTCKGGAISPGSQCISKAGGKIKYYYCDGCSGKLVQLLTSSPQSPQSALPLQRRGVEGEQSTPSEQEGK